jgi:hypothetical protein
VWASRKDKRPDCELNRTVLVETWFDWQVAIRVEGKLEGELRRAVRGQGPKRYGILCLGESQDAVQLREQAVADDDVEWFVPAGKGEVGFALPVQSGCGYGSITTAWSRFMVRRGPPVAMSIDKRGTRS